MIDNVEAGLTVVAEGDLTRPNVVPSNVSRA
jgi:hypothetical protein